MNVLVTGANGQLGNEMRIVSRMTPYHYIFTDIQEVEGLETTTLDITDEKAVVEMVKQHDIHCIVNCAAYTNVDKAEDDEELARLLNATAPKILAKAMKQVNGLLMQISTDYVFGAEPYNTPCREDQTGIPTGVYGQTKLEGEQNILQVKPNYVIIRTAWLYSEFGKNFLKTMLQLTATKPQLKVVFDQAGTPTYAYDLALAIKDVLDDYVKEAPQAEYSKNGIYHYSNEGVSSWYDFTKHIAALAGHLSCDVQPCHSSEFPSKVIRPSYSVLDKTKIKETFGVKIPYWTDSLEKCMQELAKRGSGFFFVEQ